MDVRAQNRTNLQTSPYIVPQNGNYYKNGTPQDFTLRDKIKLLQLAERIQVKKSTNKTSPIQTPKTPQELLSIATPTSKPIKNAKVTVFGNNPKNSNLQDKTPTRKSNLYSSFSWKKLQMKSDPAKTNIEHLVNLKNPVSRQHSLGIENYVTPKLNASFHVKSSSSNGFRPTKLFQNNGIQVNPIPINTTPQNCYIKSKGTFAESVHAERIPKEMDNNFWPGNFDHPQDGVIIIDDLRNCKNLAESTRLSVATVAMASPTDIDEHISTYSYPNDILCGSNNGDINSTTGYAKKQNDFTVSISSGKHVINIGPPKKSIRNGHLISTPTLKFSSHYYSNGDNSNCTQFPSNMSINLDKTPCLQANTNSYGFSPIIENPQNSSFCPHAHTTTSPSLTANNVHRKISSAQIIPLSRKSSFPTILQENPSQFTTFRSPVSSKPQEDKSSTWVTPSATNPPPTPSHYAHSEIDNVNYYGMFESSYGERFCEKNLLHFSRKPGIDENIAQLLPPIRKSKSECKLKLFPPPLSSIVPGDGSRPVYNVEDEPYFKRKRSHSLPIMNRRLPSLLDRDDLEFEKLENRRRAFFPEPSSSATSTSSTSRLPISSSQTVNCTVKMRPPESEERPVSLDIAHTKAWMRLYRDIEVSSVAAQTKKSFNKSTFPIKSTSHLHQLDLDVLDETQKSHDVCGIDAPSPKTTLFQRFSKTFSLRFGGTQKDKQVNFSKKKSKEVGSTPDLFSRGESERYRKNNTKIIRSDKCQSGDSGIQLMEEPKHYTGSLRFRRTKSDNTDDTKSTSIIDPTEPQGNLGNKKLSLVEFPNHMWDAGNITNVSTNEKSNQQEEEQITSNISTSEDIEINKLDDDGFVSNDDELTTEVNKNQSTTSTDKSNYHSLPLKYSRERKAAKQRLMKEEPIRAKVVREMVTTEQSYVKTLHDIIQGYILPCRAESALFNDQVINNIFANIEDLFSFHNKFLHCLLSSIDEQDWSQSNIGHVFTKWVDEFDIYSDYCCLNRMSMATVRQLTLNPQYEKFFEACRRLQLMDKLPLHGFLLRPIQRICQYHLQLNELLKQTDETHTDYSAVVCALDAMKAVAMRVNDTQREFDCLQEIIRLQTSIEGWEGPDLVDTNAVILQRGELVKMVEGERHKEVFVVLLNRELIICKRDSFRKGVLNFNLRINLDSSVWLNIDSNEEDECFGMVHNSWRIYNPIKSSWILFTCSSPSEKKSWISSLAETNKQYPYDAKMIEMAKLTTIQLMQTEGQLYFHGLQNNTIAKKTRKSGAKMNLDSDAMLIEVSKLKRHGPGRTTAKFYV